MVCEFLSDAPIFGLSLFTEFKLANCTCASGVDLFDKLRASFMKFHFLAVFELSSTFCWCIDFGPAEKILYAVK